METTKGIRSKFAHKTYIAKVIILGKALRENERQEAIRKNTPLCYQVPLVHLPAPSQSKETLLMPV